MAQNSDYSAIVYLVNNSFSSQNSQNHLFSASFTISEDKEKAITAITSDLSNQYLIVGNNQGEITVWKISTYAVYRRFADVVLEVCR